MDRVKRKIIIMTKGSQNLPLEFETEVIEFQHFVIVILMAKE